VFSSYSSGFELSQLSNRNPEQFAQPRGGCARKITLNREAVWSQSPGLLQPWVNGVICFSTRNGLRQLGVSFEDATALRLGSPFSLIRRRLQNG
jgi:hypothetical protein